VDGTFDPVDVDLIERLRREFEKQSPFRANRPEKRSERARWEAEVAEAALHALCGGHPNEEGEHGEELEWREPRTGDGGSKGKWPVEDDRMGHFMKSRRRTTEPPTQCMPFSFWLSCIQLFEWLFERWGGFSVRPGCRGCAEFSQYTGAAHIDRTRLAKIASAEALQSLIPLTPLNAIIVKSATAPPLPSARDRSPTTPSGTVDFIMGLCGMESPNKAL
jgi:hypothetical protein